VFADLDLARLKNARRMFMCSPDDELLRALEPLEVAGRRRD